MERITETDLKRIAEDLTKHTGFTWGFYKNLPQVMAKYLICPVSPDGEPIRQHGFSGDAKRVYNFAVGANVLGMISAGVHRNKFETVNGQTGLIMQELKAGLTLKAKENFDNIKIHETYSLNRIELEMSDNKRYVVTLEPLKCWSDKQEDQPKHGERTN